MGLNRPNWGANHVFRKKGGLIRFVCTINEINIGAPRKQISFGFIELFFAPYKVIAYNHLSSLFIQLSV